MFRLGLVGNQLRQARLRCFVDSEVVMFGPIREIGLMQPSDREYILRTNWKNFTKNPLTNFEASSPAFQEIFFPVLGRGIFTVDGQEWSDNRKISSHAFSTNELRSKMQISFSKHSKKLVQLLLESTAFKTNQPVDLQDLMQAYTFETVR